ncbi:hypothetical protein FB451DRAFT_284462 [Mycena latifolia]|nr:hypothetical protein FB451DRAFT_284462 [Mycena latifolia]
MYLSSENCSIASYSPFISPGLLVLKRQQCLASSSGAATSLSMDYQAYATAITDELRAWIHAWLSAVQSSWALHADLALPLPHPNHPLPPTFPFGARCVWKVFEWIHEYGTDQLRHRYAVALAFHGRTHGPGSSVAWKILSGNIALAVFEVAGPIYDDPALPFALGADLVVEALLASLALRCPVRLGSYLIPILSHSWARAVQFFELRTPEQEVIRHVAARCI